MSELLEKVMKEMRFIEQEKKEMKNYYIEVNYTPSGLCAMERDLLDQAKPFNNCIILEAWLTSSRYSRRFIRPSRDSRRWTSLIGKLATECSLSTSGRYA